MSKVALIQVDVSDSETPEVRVPRVLDLVDEQKGKCDLVILPELWIIGAFNSGALESYAQPRNGELVTVLQAHAKAGNFGYMVAHLLSGLLMVAWQTPQY